MDEAIRINDALSVPRSELTFRATRSGGPGGQHVNTSATRIELTWNVATTPVLSEAQRARILDRLGNRIDEAGELRLTASENRSQLRNREAVTERFAELLADALKVRKPRKRTKVPRAVKEARLQAKKRRAEVKRKRGRVVDE